MGDLAARLSHQRHCARIAGVYDPRLPDPWAFPHCHRPDGLQNHCVTAKRTPLTARQLDVLRWVADGCVGHSWPDDSHKLTARALESRGLLRVRRKDKTWHATVSECGQYYLDHGRYPEPATPPTAALTRPSSIDQAERIAQQVVHQATTRAERRSVQRVRRRKTQKINSFDHLKDIPMRYKIVVSRVQTAERYVRATSEDDAIRKVQQELERPYGFLGGWTTIGTDMDIVAAESPLADTAGTQINEEGSFLLSVKAAAKHLGISYGMLYELINRGEIAHVVIGSRRYISREQLNAFIEANTHTGYHQR